MGDSLLGFGRSQRVSAYTRDEVDGETPGFDQSMEGGFAYCAILIVVRRLPMLE